MRKLLIGLGFAALSAGLFGLCLWFQSLPLFVAAGCCFAVSDFLIVGPPKP